MLKHSRPWSPLMLFLVTLLISIDSSVHAAFEAVAPRTSHSYDAYVYDINAAAATFANETIHIEENVYLTSDRCGQANAWYISSSTSNAATITICAELVNEIVRLFKQIGTAPAAMDEAVGGTILFISVHEIAHALVDILDLPVVGEEENAADQLGVIAVRNKTAYGLWAAKFFMNTDAFNANYASRHDLNKQRAFDIICLIYGANPNKHRELERVIGPTANRCPGRYSEAKDSWGRLLSRAQSQ